jgi:hypothetical protein
MQVADQFTVARNLLSIAAKVDDFLLDGLSFATRRSTRGKTQNGSRESGTFEEEDWFENEDWR